MPQSNLFFNETENKIITKFSSEWGIPKYETIKKIIKEYNSVIKQQKTGGQ